MTQFKIAITVIAFCFLGNTQVLAQQELDTLIVAQPKYLANKTLPNFTIRLTDSTKQSTSRLKQNWPTLLVYFNPDCDHCQDEATQLMTHKDLWKKVNIVFVSTAAIPLIKTFQETYNINGSNIYIGRDEKLFMNKYYEIRFAPFVVLYNKSKQLQKVYEGGVKWQVLQQALTAL
jgi:hypothetical protein